MSEEYIPNEKVVDYAVDVWKLALANPVYQAAVPGSSDARKLMFAEIVMANAASNANKEKIDAFGVALKRILMEGIPWVAKGASGIEYVEFLDVDYNPDRHLAAAAKEAGLKMQFPVKTGMQISQFEGTHFFSFKMGYGERDLWHYLLEDGTWMLTQMYPRIIGTLLKDLNEGKLPKQPGHYASENGSYIIAKDKA